MLMAMATMGSIGSHPVVATTTAATMTPNEPAMSASASTYALFTARLPRAPSRSNANTTMFTASPPIATTSIGPASTWLELSTNRTIASTNT